jgi:hypothetical protein
VRCVAHVGQSIWIIVDVYQSRKKVLGRNIARMRNKEFAWSDWMCEQ